MKIGTSRLELVPATAELIRMEIGNPAKLGQALDAVVPAAWPPESVRNVLECFAQELEANPNTEGWAGYYWISTQENAGRRTLIGSGGFKGKPDTDGNVEVGYGVLPITNYELRIIRSESVKNSVVSIGNCLSADTAMAKARFGGDEIGLLHYPEFDAFQQVAMTEG